MRDVKWLVRKAVLVTVLGVIGALLPDAQPSIYRWLHIGQAPTLSADAAYLLRLLCGILGFVIGFLLDQIFESKDTIEELKKGWSSSFRTVLESEIEQAIDASITSRLIGSITSSGHNSAHSVLIREYIGNLESFPEFARPAAMVVWTQQRRHWIEAVRQLLDTGLEMTMNEAAALTERLGVDCTSYMLVERAPLNPTDDWTPVFTKLFIEAPVQEKVYALVTDPRTLRYGHQADAEEDGLMRGLDRLTATLDAIKRSGCKFFYLPSNKVEQEGFAALPPDTLEVFDNELAMRYCMPAEGTYARGVMRVRLVRIADCESAIQVMIRMIPTHGIQISKEKIREWRREVAVSRKPV
jgi:hypothetical protein